MNWFLWFILFILILVIAVLLDNRRLLLHPTTLYFKNLPMGLENYKILQISDLHTRKDSLHHLKSILQCQPDIIVFTGDLLNRHHYREKLALDILTLCSSVAPTYFVSGNHEWQSEQYEALLSQILDLGIHVVEDSFLPLFPESNIVLGGLRDSIYDGLHRGDYNGIQSRLHHLESQIGERDFLILLSHRPELLPLYQQYRVDLVLSGHAHGGQLQYRKNRGLYAPQQGLFPTYTAGTYHAEQTTLFVSRGAANSGPYPRIFATPECNLLILKRES